MKESFHSSSSIDKLRLKLLFKRSNHPAIFRFFILSSFYIGSAITMVATWNLEWWKPVISLAIFSVACTSSFAFLHESAHGTAFRSKFLNKFGAFLAGIMHFYPSALFRELHFTHHRYTHVPGKDPEISLGPNPGPSVVGSLPMYFSWITGLPLLLFKVMMTIVGALGTPEVLRQKLYPFIRPQKRWNVLAESLVVLIIYSLVIYFAITTNPGLWGIVIGQVIGHSFLASYLIMEHNGLAHEGNILEKTRTMPVPKVVKWIMWNMPYHAEHHAYPAVPFHALPKLHESMKSELVNTTEKHSQFHLRIVKTLFK